MKQVQGSVYGRCKFHVRFLGGFVEFTLKLVKGKDGLISCSA